MVGPNELPRQITFYHRTIFWMNVQERQPVCLEWIINQKAVSSIDKKTAMQNYKTTLVRH